MTHKSRRSSSDSSSSDSGSDSKTRKERCKERKEERKLRHIERKERKREKKEMKDKHDQSHGACGSAAGSLFPVPGHTPIPPATMGPTDFPHPPPPYHAVGGPVPTHFPDPTQHGFRSGGQHGQIPDAVYRGPSVPSPSGFRIPLTSSSAFPTNVLQIGQPPFYDLDGTSPVYIGSALLDRSVHPCKIGPHLRPFASVPYGGGEHGHEGRFDLLPFRADTMEWVRTSDGKIPSGRRPVEGGYEEGGEKLYHAVGFVNGIKVPGKTGEHLEGARLAFGGVEHCVDKYEILCWR